MLGGLASDDVQAPRPLPRAVRGPRRYHSRSTRPAASRPRSRMPARAARRRGRPRGRTTRRGGEPRPGVQPEDQPSAGDERTGPRPAGQLRGRQVDERVPPENGRPPELVAGRSGAAGRRPWKLRPESVAWPRSPSRERSIPVASAPRSARYAVTCPGPEPTSTTGCPAAWATTRSSSQVSNGSCSSSSTRWSAYAVATASYDERTCVALVPAGDDHVPVHGGAASACRDRPEEVHPAPVLLPGSPFQRAPGAEDAAIRRRHASTSPRSANACNRSARVRSSPGACAPRSRSTVSSARSSGSSPSAHRGPGGTSASAARRRTRRSGAVPP